MEPHGNGSTGDDAPGDEDWQPTTFAFDEMSEAQVARALVKYPSSRKSSAVLPLLWIVQHQMARQTGSRWVPRVAMDVVAQRLEMPPIRVYEVATFYAMYNKVPVGRWHLQVCTTTPCWLRGSDAVVSTCKRVTGIQAWGETSTDGLFTMTEVECLGACVNAPILQVNDDFYEDMDAETTERLLDALGRGEPPVPGSMRGRQTSAPDGGPTTLTTLENLGGPYVPLEPAE